MNARKAVLADNPELILHVLQLRFDESLSYPRISAQTGVSKTAIFSLVRIFMKGDHSITPCVSIVVA